MFKGGVLLQNDPSVFNEGMTKWREAEEEMMRLLHKAADACYLQGLIDEGIKQKYVLSGIKRSCFSLMKKYATFSKLITAH